ncbi:two-component system sensor histidine kinase CiaH [Lachnospiraceae bacterium PM6-15]|uniref:sensor histidine kinase n=1 Tax=Ohessyouella blattaphilus TaxID=2949333 RepID=UPI003E230E9C
MIKKLRNKFILITMSLLAVVLAVVFGAIGIIQVRGQINESHKKLEMASRTLEPKQTPKFELGKPPEERDMGASFTVELDSEGNITALRDENYQITTSDVEKLIQAVTENESGSGILTEYNLRYLVSNTPHGTSISFLDIHQERNDIVSTVIISLLAYLVSLALLFIISLYLARWITKPIEESWNKQKRFVADASHDLKTPLTVILANLDIMEHNLREEAPSAEQFKWLESSRSEAGQMKILIEEMLMLAKLDDEQQQLATTNVNLSDLLTEQTLAFESLAYERKISLEEDIAEDVVIKGNEMYLRRLLQILLDNGIKYSLPDHPVTSRLKAENNQIILAISNQGNVMDKETTSHLFERFYRSETSRSTDGFGLGLAIAEQIVKLHHGIINAECDDTGMITFTVMIPK